MGSSQQSKPHRFPSWLRKLMAARGGRSTSSSLPTVKANVSDIDGYPA